MFHEISITKDLSLSFIGAPLSEGPLPSLFYFALSAEDSLKLDPYNQIVSFLSSFPLRIFSMDLPAHGKGLSPYDAIHRWAQELSQGHNVIAEFIDQFLYAFQWLQKEQALQMHAIATAGLSRGGFIACHAAAKIKNISTILGFAPVTTLSFLKEFQDIKDLPLVAALDLMHLCPELLGKTLRFYIGNRDICVGTAQCFDFIQNLVETFYNQGIRSAPVELILSPSIGRLGHGTSKEIFHQGALFIARHLGVSHD